MDASYQFPRFKWFRKIVVRSNLQTDDAIRRFSFSVPISRSALRAIQSSHCNDNDLDRR